MANELVNSRTNPLDLESTRSQIVLDRGRSYLGVSGEIQGRCGQDLLRKRWGWGGVKSGHRR